MGGVSGKDSPLVSRRRAFPRVLSALKLDVAHVEAELPRVHIYDDRVAVTDEGERSPTGCLRRNVPDHQTSSRSREATIRYKRDGVAEPRSDQRSCHVKHLAHSWATRRPFVANDNHIARCDCLRLDRSKASLL